MLDHLQFSSVFDPIGGGFFKQAKDYSCKEPFYEKTLEIMLILLIYMQMHMIISKRNHIK
jgi:uncharacterized protein YyaL (SSP411 family)